MPKTLLGIVAVLVFSTTQIAAQPTPPRAVDAVRESLIADADRLQSFVQNHPLTERAKEIRDSACVETPAVEELLTGYFEANLARDKASADELQYRVFSRLICISELEFSGYYNAFASTFIATSDRLTGPEKQLFDQIISPLAIVLLDLSRGEFGNHVFDWFIRNRAQLIADIGDGESILFESGLSVPINQHLVEAPLHWSVMWLKSLDEPGWVFAKCPLAEVKLFNGVPVCPSSCDALADSVEEAPDSFRALYAVLHEDLQQICTDLSAQVPDARIERYVDGVFSCFRDHLRDTAMAGGSWMYCTRKTLANNSPLLPEIRRRLGIEIFARRNCFVSTRLTDNQRKELSRQISELDRRLERLDQEIDAANREIEQLMSVADAQVDELNRLIDFRNLYPMSSAIIDPLIDIVDDKIQETNDSLDTAEQKRDMLTEEHVEARKEQQDLERELLESNKICQADDPNCSDTCGLPSDIRDFQECIREADLAGSALPGPGTPDPEISYTRYPNPEAPPVGPETLSGLRACLESVFEEQRPEGCERSICPANTQEEDGNRDQSACPCERYTELESLPQEICERRIGWVSLDQLPSDGGTVGDVCAPYNDEAGGLPPDPSVFGSVQFSVE